ncbi:hypothetical protein ACKGJO_10915 [Gracilimonas sp. Q87]|uniref:hypothetical protein n=1 Tax=Gracilimonas sp. Q87 TaxID=3384766 RepID=UPI0039842F29
MINLEEHISQVITQAVYEGIMAAMKDIERTISRVTTPPYLIKQGVMELTGWSGRTI